MIVALFFLGLAGLNAYTLYRLVRLERAISRQFDYEERVYAALANEIYELRNDVDSVASDVSSIEDEVNSISFAVDELVY